MFPRDGCQVNYQFGVCDQFDGKKTKIIAKQSNLSCDVKKYSSGLYSMGCDVQISVTDDITLRHCNRKNLYTYKPDLTWSIFHARVRMETKQINHKRPNRAAQ